MQLTVDSELRYHKTALDDPGKRVSGGPFELIPSMNVHDYFEQVGRYNLLIAKDDLNIGLQFDEVALFSNRYVLDGREQATTPLYDPTVQSPFDDAYFLIEKMFVSKKWDTVELTVGDTYASFGRGLALNIVKNTDIDVDTSIRGAKGIFRTGDFDLTAISGITNQQQISQENPNVAIAPNVDHMVSGVRAEWFGPVNLGAHAVAYKFARPTEIPLAVSATRYSSDLDVGIVGANVEANGVLGLDIYGEYALYDYQAEDMTDGNGRLRGWATYSSVAAYPGKAVVLLEAKASKDTERLTTFTTLEGWEPASIPTLEYERVITEDGSAAVNSNDIMGTRLRVDYAIVPGMFTPYVATTLLIDKDTEGLHFNDNEETILHPMAGVEWRRGTGQHSSTPACGRTSARTPQRAPTGWSTSMEPSTSRSLEKRRWKSTSTPRSSSGASTSSSKKTSSRWRTRWSGIAARSGSLCSTKTGQTTRWCSLRATCSSSATTSTGRSRRSISRRQHHLQGVLWCLQGGYPLLGRVSVGACPASRVRG